MRAVLWPRFEIGCPFCRNDSQAAGAGDHCPHSGWHCLPTGISRSRFSRVAWNLANKIHCTIQTRVNANTDHILIEAVGIVTNITIPLDLLRTIESIVFTIMCHRRIFCVARTSFTSSFLQKPRLQSRRRLCDFDGGYPKLKVEYVWLLGYLGNPRAKAFTLLTAL